MRETEGERVINKQQLMHEDNEKKNKQIGADRS